MQSNVRSARRVSAAVVVMAVALSLLVLVDSPVAAAEAPWPDLLTNASFETTGGWHTLAPAAGGAVNLATYQDASRAIEGSGFGEMNTQQPDGSIYQDLATMPTVGKSFTFSMWLRSPSGAPVTGRLVLWGIGGTNESTAKTFTVDGQWRLVSTALNPTSNHSSLRAQLYLQTTGAQLDADGAQVRVPQLTNASFEASGGWSVYSDQGGTFNIVDYQDETRSFEGRGFREMNTTKPQASIVQSIFITPTPGSSYTFSMWVRSPSGVPVAGHLLMSSEGGAKQEVESTNFIAGAQWSLVTTALNVTQPDHTGMRALVFLGTAYQNLDIDGGQVLSAGLANASFENYDAYLRVPEGWWPMDPAGGATYESFVQNYSQAAEASSYAQAISLRAAGGSIYQDVATTAPVGSSHAFSVWVRSTSGAPLNGRVVLWGLGGTTERGDTAFTVGKQWTLISAGLNPVNAGHTTLRAQIYLDTQDAYLDVDGASLGSGNARPAFTVPGAPAGVTATPGVAQATVSWATPASIGRRPVTGYTVTAAPGGATCTTSALSCVVGGLTNGTPYTFTVTATNTMGTGPPSLPSTAVTPRTVPEAPRFPVAFAGLGAATVAWSAPVSNGGAPITGYTVTAAPGGATCTTTGATNCRVTGLTAGSSHTFTVTAANSAGTGPPSPASSPVVPWSGSAFHSVVPNRVLDSRTPTGGWNARLAAGAPRDLQVIGLGGGSNVPTGSTAVVLNVTATGASAGSFVSVWPAGTPQPIGSNLNFAAGETIPNLVTVKVGAGGKVSFANAVGSVDVIADVVGYYDDGNTVGDLFTGITPTRLLDSRGTNGGWNAKLAAGSPRDLVVRKPGNGAGVPATATAVIANVTVTGGTKGSFVSVWPSGLPQPNVSNLNFGPGQTIPNLTIVQIGTNGAIRFANAVGSVDVIVDVVGYFDPTTGSRFHPINPTRILDDRVGTGLTGPWGPDQTRTLKVAGAAGTNVPSGATGLVANVTATGGTAGSFVTVYPSGVRRPISTNLNFGPGQTIPNLVTTTLPANGAIDLYNAFGNVDLIADAVGYYAST